MNTIPLPATTTELLAHLEARHDGLPVAMYATLTADELVAEHLAEHAAGFVTHTHEA